MNYIVDHIPKSKTKRPGTKAIMQYLTIHNTGNPKSTARNERDYLANPINTKSASFHIVIDEKETIECIPLDEVAYHAGTPAGNNTSIGIEVCESGDQSKVWDNATTLLAKMLNERDWGVDKLRAHKSWSGKECPRLILPRWDEFVKEVSDKMQGIEATKIKEMNTGKVLEGIIIDGVSYMQVNELRKLGKTVNWNGKEKIVEINL
jgi:N-acetylmuramoyl-L-alanine amidase